MAVVDLSKFTVEQKARLVQELGYQTDGEFVLQPDGRILKDKYTDAEVRLANMAIVPGSVLILDNSPVSLACYVSEYES